MRVDDIYVDDHRRPLDLKAVEILKDSITRLGLLNPITITRRDGVDYFGDGDLVDNVPVLVAGRHRLAAVKALGHERIEAFMVQYGDIDARLAEISENLHRAELTVQERSDQIAEWVRLVADKNKGVQVEHPSNQQPHDKGISAATRELGIDRAKVVRAVQIASIGDEAKGAAAAAGLADNQSALLEIAAAPQDQQAAVVEELATRKARSTSPTGPRVLPMEELTPKVRQRATKQLHDMMFYFFPHRHEEDKTRVLKDAAKWAQAIDPSLWPENTQIALTDANLAACIQTLEELRKALAAGRIIP
jgi:ParB family chromosome partitioning protein